MALHLAITEFDGQVSTTIGGHPSWTSREAMQAEVDEHETVVDVIAIELHEDEETAIGALAQIPGLDEAFDQLLLAAFEAGRRYASR